MSISATTGLAGLKFLYDVARKEGWLESLRRALKTRHRIVVVGCSGVGKTNFVHSLLSEVVEAEDRILGRTRYPLKDIVAIDGDVLEMWDTPGQHPQRRAPALAEAMRLGVAGVVNVVCHGYHEVSAVKPADVLAEGAAEEGFLEARRQAECDDLAGWVTHVSALDRKPFVITLVSKADLWWHNREQVLRHYEQSAYRRALAAAGLSDTVVPYCSVTHKFYGEGALSRYFDDADRREIKNALVVTILEALGKRKAR